MYKLLITAALAMFAASPAVATEQTDVMVPVHQFVDGFNKGDVNSALATCAEQTSIIDEFPPHEWHGAGACAKWADDYDANAKKEGITDGVVTLGKPRHVDVSGDRAYVVVPASYTFKQKGKAKKETHAVMALSLQKVAAGWRITGWSWAAP
ncbi:MAG TPA: nuclear transport factor 2 family protein [Rudaea sp.]|nr:nuclear transport factor 2 family protein [Rudaea sp.]